MNTANPQKPSNPTPRSPWRTSAIALVLLGSGFALGAASIATAHDGMMGGGWHHHGPRVGMIQHVVRGALENVGATTTQEDKIHDIIAATYTDLQQDKADHVKLRKQMLDLLSVPTIDKAAIEKLRAAKIAEIDAKSKKITSAVVDAAGQLTPEQRAKLAENMQHRLADRGWGFWHRHGEGHEGPGNGDHGQNDHGSGDHDHGDGPDHG